MATRRKTATALRLDPKLLRAMRRYKTATGVPLTAQIERAMRWWLLDQTRAVRKGDRHEESEESLS